MSPAASRESSDSANASARSASEALEASDARTARLQAMMRSHSVSRCATMCLAGPKCVSSNASGPQAAIASRLGRHDSRSMSGGGAAGTAGVPCCDPSPATSPTNAIPDVSSR